MSLILIEGTRKKHMEYTHGVKLNWHRVIPGNMIHDILDREFSGWKPANFEENFNGQTMHAVETAIAFKTPEDATQFVLKYGGVYGMTPTTDLWYNVRPF